MKNKFLHLDLAKFDEVFADYDAMLRRQDLAHADEKVNITSDTTRPEQRAEAMVDATIAKHFDAISMDVASLEAGNWKDIDRVNAHASSLAQFAEQHKTAAQGLRHKLIPLIKRLEHIKSNNNPPESLGPALNNLRAI